MNLKASGKFCPVCKKKNPLVASYCQFCGTRLDENLPDIDATTKNAVVQPDIPAENLGSFIDIALIPEGGIGFYVGGSLKADYLQLDRELIVGRKPESSQEFFLDLTGLDAFNLGVSRRHAMIRRAESGFEVVDLGSTNGTWLNSERLVPNKAYLFASGAQIRFGHMRLYVMYRTVLNGAKKK